MRHSPLGCIRLIAVLSAVLSLGFPVSAESVRVVEIPRGWAFQSSAGEAPWRVSGMEKANASGPDCGKLGFPYAEAVKRAGLDRRAWCRKTIRQLEQWGFNTLGTSCDTWLNETQAFWRTEMMAISAWMQQEGEEYVISVNRKSPCGPVANMFHPRFAEICDKAAKASSRFRTTKKFLGYYLDNELNWWGRGNWWECGLLDAVLTQLPKSHTARIEAERILGENPDRRVARKIFTERAARIYFSTIRKAIRRYDPDHLILGCRFAGVAGAPNEVWRICGEECDVVSVNCYPTADIEKGTLSFGVADGFLPPGYKKTQEWTPVPMEVMLKQRYDICRKPLLITEWSFRGGDVGIPRAESNGQELPTQQARARAIGLFLDSVNNLDYIVGHFFYKWCDERYLAHDGKTVETMNWGVVSMDDTPHDLAVKAFVAASRTFGKVKSDVQKHRARFGVISDIHLSVPDSVDVFEHALRYFDEMTCDGVVLCGDLTEFGLTDELQQVGTAWFKVFPDGRRSDGGKIEPLFIYGDHDMGGYMHKRLPEKNLPEKVIPLTSPVAAWKAAFREAWSPVQVKKVKGYTFILAHHPGDQTASRGGQQIPGVEEVLRRYAVKGDKPFFYVQHRVVRGTAGGEWAWGQDNGESRRMLNQYPNVIAFFGHGHVQCQDEMSIWQDEFTAVEVPSLRYVSIRGGRENSRGHDDVPSLKQPAVNTGGGKQGLLVDLYDDRMVIARRDFIHDCVIAAPWVVPFPFAASDRPYNHARRAKEEIAPEFPPTAQIKVRRRKALDRVGAEHEVYDVLIPPVPAGKTTPRAFDYEVTAEISTGDVVRIAKQKRVYSYNGHFPEHLDTKPFGCVFALNELSAQANRIRFLVRPCGCFGAKGKALVTDWMKFSNRP